MKQKDIALVLVIAIVSAVVSVLLSGFLVGGSGAKQQQVEVVDSLTDTFTQPDKKYFNDQSINPTQVIRIQDNTVQN